MSSMQRSDLPDTVLQFLRNLDGALGDRLVAVVLYGSHANNSADRDSDMDLAVIVSDADSEVSRQVTFRVLGASGVDTNAVSLSVETYMNLKEYLRLGDPFAWVVCSEGQILKERDELLTELQKQCVSSSDNLDSPVVTKYLRGKSYTHYVQAMQGLSQFLSNIQLSAMAGAQAVAVNQSKGDVSGGKLVGMADWSPLKSILQETSATKREIETVEQLVMAHKLARKENGDAPTKEISDMVRSTGELWTRLLPETSTEEGG